jgi:hypothetical protein
MARVQGAFPAERAKNNAAVVQAEAWTRAQNQDISSIVVYGEISEDSRIDSGGIETAGDAKVQRPGR